MKMNRIDVFELRKRILFEEFDYTLLSSVLSGYSGVRQKINELLKSGVITRVKKGLYVFGPDYSRAPVCVETLANLIYGPSCISLEYALAHHGLIPERVETVTSVTPKRDKNFSTPLGNFSYRYLEMEKYVLGIEHVWLDSRHPVLMASPEKALCDYLLLNKVPEFENKKEAEIFLCADLRIDKNHWNQFNPENLKKMNQIYRKKNIAFIVELL